MPVGSVLVLEDNIISEGHNQPIMACDPTAHAEIIALRAGAKKLNNYRLLNTTLYVTLEPCVMCFSALVHARISRLVYACRDPKAGAISVFNLDKALHFNHRFEIVEGICAEESRVLLKQFFLKRRNVRE